MTSIVVLVAGSWSILVLVACINNATWLDANVHTYTITVYTVDSIAVFFAVVLSILREHKRMLWQAFAKLHPDTVPQETWCTIA